MKRRTVDTGGGYGAWIALGSWIVAAALVAGCSPGPDHSKCKPACESPFRCDSESGRCRPKPLDVEAPGRGLDATEFRDTAYLSAVHPSENFVVAGPVAESRSLKILASLDSGARTDTALDGNEEAGVIAVAWRGRDGAYRVANRSEDGWKSSRPIEADEEYAGSRDFDIAVDPNGDAHLLFRDAEANQLHHLSRTSDRTWSVQAVDDGSTVNTRTECAPNGTDLGYDPDAEFISRGLAAHLTVSYYDAACGDLRLARRSDETWAVRVVDKGTFSIGAIDRTGDVGEFSALAGKPNGTIAVAYHDARRAGLAFASETDGSFGTALIDPGLEGGRKHLRGAFADLAFDEDGTPYAAYLDATTGRLRLATRRDDGGGWILRPVGRESPTGFYAQVLVVDERLILLAERLERSNGAYRSRLFRSIEDLP